MVSNALRRGCGGENRSICTEFGHSADFSSSRIWCLSDFNGVVPSPWIFRREAFLSVEIYPMSPALFHSLRLWRLGMYGDYYSGDRFVHRLDLWLECGVRGVIHEIWDECDRTLYESNFARDRMFSRRYDRGSGARIHQRVIYYQNQNASVYSTLGMLSIARGLAEAVTVGWPLQITSDPFRYVGQGLSVLFRCQSLL